jgi:hypothetical protein
MSSGDIFNLESAPIGHGRRLGRVQGPGKVVVDGASHNDTPVAV